MKEKEFNLSEKVVYLEDGTTDEGDDIFREVIETEDVKEFIKRLIEEINPDKNDVLNDEEFYWIEAKIDALAGEKLTK